jgi:hypothetical protein
LMIGIGALVIPGFGAVVADRVWAAALGVAGGTAVASAGIGAAAGELLGASAGLGIPESEARYFETGFRTGGLLVTVEAGAARAGGDGDPRPTWRGYGAGDGSRGDRVLIPDGG